MEFIIYAGGLAIAGKPPLPFAPRPLHPWLMPFASLSPCDLARETRRTWRVLRLAQWQKQSKVSEGKAPS